MTKAIDIASDRYLCSYEVIDTTSAHMQPLFSHKHLVVIIANRPKPKLLKSSYTQAHHIVQHSQKAEKPTVSAAGSLRNVSGLIIVGLVLVLLGLGMLFVVLLNYVTH